MYGLLAKLLDLGLPFISVSSDVEVYIPQLSPDQPATTTPEAIDRSPLLI